MRAREAPLTLVHARGMCAQEREKAAAAAAGLRDAEAEAERKATENAKKRQAEWADKVKKARMHTHVASADARTSALCICPLTSLRLSCVWHV